MSPDRLLTLLMADSPRWLGEATHHLASAEAWIRDGQNLAVQGSPLIDFYRCIHAFKGACSLMAAQLPVAARICSRLHEMEGRLAVKDRWVEAASWLGDFHGELHAIRHELQRVWQESHAQAGESASKSVERGALPTLMKARSGDRELVFPWSSVLEVIPGVQVQGRPLVPVQGEILAVIPPQGPAHENVLFGVALSTQTGRKIVVPVQSLELVFETKPEQSDSGPLSLAS